MRTLALCAVLLLGCQKKASPDIPAYPDAMGIKGAGTMQDKTMVLFNNRWTTLASTQTVQTFYEKNLLSRPGWTLKGDTRERVVFTDGNLQPTGELYAPIDPTKSGGWVELVNAGDQRTMIDIWQSFPAPQ